MVNPNNVTVTILVGVNRASTNQVSDDEENSGGNGSNNGESNGGGNGGESASGNTNGGDTNGGNNNGGNANGGDTNGGNTNGGNTNGGDTNGGNTNGGNNNGGNTNGGDTNGGNANGGDTNGGNNNGGNTNGGDTNGGNTNNGDTNGGNTNGDNNNGGSNEKTNKYEEYGLSDEYVPDDYEDKSGSPMILEGKHLTWNVSNDKSYWYENGIKQGTYYDSHGVMGDGTIRGREIYDSESDGWYWLDSVYDGAKAVGKEVWVPYIYQNEDDWDEETVRNIANESDEGMRDLVFQYIKGKQGKWVRYDENGRMLKGWVTIEGALADKYPDQAGNTYYYDNRTGLMAKGWITIDGTQHYFNETTGVLEQ